MDSIGAVLLAAGSSSRFGDENKLVADFEGQPLIRHVASIVSESGVGDVIVVTGHDRDAVEAALDGLPVRFVHNEDWSAGMGRSIARGIRALRPDTPAAFIVPGDMPFLTAALLEALAGRYADAEGTRVVVPTTEDGRQRNPVLWPRRCFDDLASLDGPEGGKALLQRHWPEALLVPIADASVFTDIDTPDDLKKT
ncbi:MAG TPA: nucleotidyltransferase family protein [Hyphomicrobium sp.]|nr:nucleotidyltransferase family protein [Hyphomicrobium sp.]HRO49463.1 nucleotidyltransferase family protein [Hyphomicrobium sp.]